MFKPSQPMMARLRLTTKQVNGGYYKGNRTGSMGYFKRSTYIIDPKKLRTYVVPQELDQFPLTPFVTKTMPPTRSIYTKTIERNGKEVETEKGFKGEDYLEHWAQSNVEEALSYERQQKHQLRLRKQAEKENRLQKEEKQKQLKKEKKIKARTAQEKSAENALDNESQS